MVQLKWKQANYDKDCIYQQLHLNCCPGIVKVSLNDSTQNCIYFKTESNRQTRLQDLSVYPFVCVCVCVFLFVGLSVCQQKISFQLPIKRPRLLLVSHIWSDIFQFKGLTQSIMWKQSIKDKLRGRVFLIICPSFSFQHNLCLRVHLQHLLYGYFTLFIRPIKRIFDCTYLL